MARNYGPAAKWIEGVIQLRQGPVSYVVETEKGLWKRHIDQLRLETGPTRDTPPSPTPAPDHPRPEAVPEVTAPTPPALIARYPARNRQPPDYFGH